MTLEGWTISKHMCAGLIPGVNIRTRPRVMFMFIMGAIDDASFRVNLALLSSPNVDTKEMYQSTYDQAIPPLSRSKVLAEDAKKMFAAFDKITKRNKKK